MLTVADNIWFILKCMMLRSYLWSHSMKRQTRMTITFDGQSRDYRLWKDWGPWYILIWHEQSHNCVLGVELSQILQPPFWLELKFSQGTILGTNFYFTYISYCDDNIWLEVTYLEVDLGPSSQDIQFVIWRKASSRRCCESLAHISVDKEAEGLWNGLSGLQVCSLLPSQIYTLC